jgi:hypothetical protein
MSNWEYKLISSGKGGFASPALMEKFLNDLGQENWEIISFHQPPDNPLAFHGLARRSTQKDWTLEDAAKAAARAEADKLRAEFEAKFKAGTGQGGASAEEEAETFLAEEKSAVDGDLRRLRDTSRDDDPDAPEDDTAAAGPKDEWDKLAEEDELPAFFDAIRPHMRRNQRGPGMSVGLDYLAKKWHLDESDLKTALVECGFQIPADENAKPVYVEYEGELYWVNINRRGEIWVNLRDKPQPVFRVVQGKRVENTEEPAKTDAAPASESADAGSARDEAAGESGSGGQQRPSQEEPSRGPKTFLDKVRGQMRRNRRGHGWSGSFPFLTKAFKTDEAGLLAQLAEHGVKLPEGDDRGEAQSGDFTYWLQKNQRGEIWINAELTRKKQKTESGGPATDAATETAPVAPAAEAGSSTAPDQAPAAPEPVTASPATTSTLPPENTLTAVRLLMQPKKRGEGVTALVSELAAKLEKTPEVLMAALAAAGLTPPDSPKGKPTFAEHGGELYWLNVSAKGEIWLNAKPAAATKKSKAKKSDAGE